MTEEKICPWKKNVEFQYNPLSEEKKKDFENSKFYAGYEKCIKCSGIDESCSKYKQLKKTGAV